MTSADMFQAGLRLQQMERHESAPPASFDGPPGGTFGNGMNGNARNGMNKVELASQIMKRGDPGMEPGRALELAKRFNGSI